MTGRRLRSLIVAAALLAAGPVCANGTATYAEALSDFTAGRFEACSELGTLLGTARGYALAARATLVRALYLTPADERVPLYRTAAEQARAALDREPGHVEATLQLVVALGNLARASGPLSAHVAGYAEEARKLLDSAIAREPDNSFAYAILGAWHTEIVHEAGPLLASNLYGATQDDALAAFERARELAPESILVLTEFAKALVRLDGERFARRAEELLNRAVALPPRNALEVLVQEDAGEQLSALLRPSPQRVGGRGG